MHSGNAGPGVPPSAADTSRSRGSLARGVIPIPTSTISIINWQKSAHFDVHVSQTKHVMVLGTGANVSHVVYIMHVLSLVIISNGRSNG